jgi:predicted transcriptional regulator
MCLSILDALDNNGPLKITHLMQKSNINCKMLTYYFDFLFIQGAVEEKYVDRGQIVYAITERGLHLSRFLNELNQGVSKVKFRSEIPSNKINNTLNQYKHKEYC